MDPILTSSSALGPKNIIRHLAPTLRESMEDSPAVLVNGPRQCGKTTLVQQFSESIPYITLDDTNVLAAALQDPLGFVRRFDRVIIDEVQRAPQLLLAVKLCIDQDRRPGRFLLTGSANLMASPHIADSLAGRVALHTLLPLSQSEIHARENDFLQRAVSQNWLAINGSKRDKEWHRTPDNPFVEHVLAGGYPEMRQRAKPARKQAWARAYIQTLVERDVQDIAQIEHLSQLPHLLSIAATQCGQLFNASHIGGQLNLNLKTVDKYFGILEKLFLIQRVPAWSRNELSRLIKAPKLHFLDAGLQATLTRLNSELIFIQRARWCATLETWVYAELRKAMSLSTNDWFISHYRDKDQVEVDFVLENAHRQLIAIEVKASATINAADFKGIKRLKDQASDEFVSGIVLYDGEHALPFGDRLWAVPLSCL